MTLSNAIYMAHGNLAQATQYLAHQNRAIRAGHPPSVLEVMVIRPQEGPQDYSMVVTPFTHNGDRQNPLRAALHKAFGNPQPNTTQEGLIVYTVHNLPETVELNVGGRLIPVRFVHTAPGLRQGPPEYEHVFRLTGRYEEKHGRLRLGRERSEFPPDGVEFRLAYGSHSARVQVSSGGKGRRHKGEYLSGLRPLGIPFARGKKLPVGVLVPGEAYEVLSPEGESVNLEALALDF